MATALSLSIDPVGYDAPGATVPMIVTLAGVPAGSRVTFSVPNGFCNPAADARWSRGSTVYQECYARLPSKTWRGRLTASARLTAANGGVRVVSGRSAGQTYTAGTASAAMTQAQIEAIEHCGNTSRYVWLTFDDRIPNAATARSIVAVLAKNHVRGRFYLNQISAADRSLLVRNGEVIQNHTRDHVRLNTQSAKGIRALNPRVPEQSARPAQLRPPYGAGSFDTFVVSTAASAGYQVCRWTTDTSDWAGASASLMGSRVRYGDATTRPAVAGGVILMHATHFTPAKLQAVINAIRARDLAPEPSGK